MHECCCCIDCDMMLWRNGRLSVSEANYPTQALGHPWLPVGWILNYSTMNCRWSPTVCQNQVTNVGFEAEQLAEVDKVGRIH